MKQVVQIIWQAYKVKSRPKAGLHKTVSASKAIFFSNTAKNRYGRRQPYHSDFSCLSVKSSLLKCFAVLLYGFFFATRNIHAEILDVFQGDIPKLQRKRQLQNRIPFYGAPPKVALFIRL